MKLGEKKLTRQGVRDLGNSAVRKEGSRKADKGVLFCAHSYDHSQSCRWCVIEPFISGVGYGKKHDYRCSKCGDLKVE